MGFITTTSAPTRIAIAFTFSSSTLEGASSSSSNYHNQKNPKTLVMKKKQQEEEKRNKVVSFRLSEREYARHLLMAKLCYENGLTKNPDIVSYIRVSMECLWQYINSQARGDLSAENEKNLQQRQEKQEGGVEPQQDFNYHAVSACMSRIEPEYIGSK
jgi:hypothetical protein